MGLWEFLQQWPHGRRVAGVGLSLLLHVAVMVSVLWGTLPGVVPKWSTRPGETLFVELPRPEERGSPGRPAPPSSPPREVAPAPAPAPQPGATSPPARQRQVASAPAPTPRAPAPPEPRPLTRAPEPAPRVAQPPVPPPEPAPTPVTPPPPAPEPAPVGPQPAPAPAEQAAGATAAQPPATTATPPPTATDPAPSVERARGEGERQIASLPPGRPERPSVSDVRAALRAGSGGRGLDRGGIEGEPIPLDSPDPRFSDYLEQVRRKIKEKWGFPCVKNTHTRECDYHTTTLLVQFGILRNGQVQFVDVLLSASHEIYDEYAVNAIKLAGPFPPVPAAMMRTMRAGSTGVPINARFSYVVESSLTNLLR